MSEKVVMLPGAALMDGTPRENVGLVNMLKELLEEAERGQITCICFSTVNASGTTGSGFFYGDGRNTLSLLAGALIGLQWRVGQLLEGSCPHKQDY